MAGLPVNVVRMLLSHARESTSLAKGDPNEDMAESSASFVPWTVKGNQQLRGQVEQSEIHSHNHLNAPT